jgi:hypothetical protein
VNSLEVRIATQQGFCSGAQKTAPAEKRRYNTLPIQTLAENCPLKEKC